MDNQHQMIKGYRDLTQGEIDTMNEIKRLGEQVGGLIEKLQSMQQLIGMDPKFIPDGRWIAIGKTHLQEGFMALTRAVAKPTSF